MVMVFLLMELGRSLYFDRAEWRHVFLLFAIGRLQFLEASYYRPPQFRNEILKSWLVVVVTLPLLKSYILYSFISSRCFLLLETHAQAVPHDVPAQTGGRRHGRGECYEGASCQRLQQSKHHCEGLSS